MTSAVSRQLSRPSRIPDIEQAVDFAGQGSLPRTKGRRRNLRSPKFIDTHGAPVPDAGPGYGVRLLPHDAAEPGGLISTKPEGTRPCFAALDWLVLVSLHSASVAPIRASCGSRFAAICSAAVDAWVAVNKPHRDIRERDAFLRSPWQSLRTT